MLVGCSEVLKLVLYPVLPSVVVAGAMTGSSGSLWATVPLINSRLMSKVAECWKVSKWYELWEWD